MFEAANRSELRRLGLDASPRTKGDPPVEEKKEPAPTEVDPVTLSVSTRYWLCLWLGGDD